MDQNPFDHRARIVRSSVSRRSVVKSVAGGLLGVLGATAIGVEATSAQTPGPVASPVGSPTPDRGIGREDFTVNFGDFTTKAQLTYPAGTTGPFPTVILIPGSTPADMDFTVTDRATGTVRSHIFLDIADDLSRRGYGIVRYNKHYVTGPNDAAGAQTYYAKITLPQLLADAGKVYAAAAANPKVDPKRIVVYGWSEGSPIATQLAVTQPDVAGLVLQGPVSGSWKDTFQYQSVGLGVPFLQQIVDANKDGIVTMDELLAALRAHPGTVSAETAFTLFDPNSSPSAPKFNAALDRNHDGQLDIEREVTPFLTAYFANFDQFNQSPAAPFHLYTSANQLPTILASIASYHGPILILQGEHDANVSPEGAKQIDAALAAAGARDHRLILYPTLGHSLGPAASTDDDFFAPIAPQPLEDLAAWLDARLRR